MSREAQTPLILWICAGVVFHMVCKDGAEQVAQVVEDRANIRALVQSVREGLRPEDTTFEVLVEAPPTPSPQEAEAPQKETPDEAKTESDPDEPKDEPKPPKVAEKKKDPPKPAEDKKADAPPPPPVAAVPPPPPAPKPEEAKPAEPLPPPPPPDHRIAIRQHVEPNQKDNPNANRIADQANTVQEETVAKLRSHDHDDPNPNAGAMKKPSPTGDTGNNDHDKVAQSEEKAGTDNAPGESKDRSTSAEHHNHEPPAPQQVARAASAPPAIPGGKAGNAGGPASPSQAAAPPSPGGAGPSSPEVVASEGGDFTLDPANPGGDGRSKIAGRKRRQPAPYQAPVKVGSVGLNAPGQPGGPNLNLSMAGVEAAVGHEKLKAERAADGAARRSAHRGKWDKNNFGAYRAAIENYEPSVKIGNQTALNAAQVPFATYLNTVHNRLHPIFAEEFLASLDNLPSEHSLNKQLVTHLEIVLSKDEGKIVRMGVTRQSGVTAFDIVALNAFKRASPYGKAPEAIVSHDGNVYLHWEFHRDPFDACTTRNAFPYMLPAQKGGTVAPVAPPRQAPSLSPTDERRTPPPLLPLRNP
ncbi:hypothetical protein [Polyangium aurulentum]|uniref:hypothetical protein n=1 Tax=Polyangium aurulentum TaxID=2567896 RepID=UPI0010ADC6D4|nr:hypothetical protein [Polyangium aurulentum]UQA58247.1 hypothetical protein E8A73_044530 [Polyangium aurulentum]